VFLLADLELIGLMFWLADLRLLGLVFGWLV
jgi:hypothetical protein